VRPNLRHARSLAGAPHAGSCALLQTLYLLRSRTHVPPCRSTRPFVSPSHRSSPPSRQLQGSTDHSDRPTGPCCCSTGTRETPARPCRGHKNRPRTPPAGCLPGPSDAYPPACVSDCTLAVFLSRPPHPGALTQCT